MTTCPHCNQDMTPAIRFMIAAFAFALIVDAIVIWRHL